MNRFVGLGVSYGEIAHLERSPIHVYSFHQGLLTAYKIGV